MRRNRNRRDSIRHGGRTRGVERLRLRLWYLRALGFGSLQQDLQVIDLGLQIFERRYHGVELGRNSDGIDLVLSAGSCAEGTFNEPTLEGEFPLHAGITRPQQWTGLVAVVHLGTGIDVDDRYVLGRKQQYEGECCRDAAHSAPRRKGRRMRPSPEGNAIETSSEVVAGYGTKSAVTNQERRIDVFVSCWMKKFSLVDSLYAGRPVEPRPQLPYPLVFGVQVF